MSTYLLHVVGAPEPARRTKRKRDLARDALLARLRAAMCVCAEHAAPPLRITAQA